MCTTDYSTDASHVAFSESLCELDGIISAETYDNVIIAGDFNVDFSRSGPNCSNLSMFMQSNNIVCVDQLFNINFTYHKDDYSCFSSPDHILTSSDYAYLIDHVFTHDSAENFSDHLSLHVDLKFSNFLVLVYLLVFLMALMLLVTSLLTGLKSTRMISHLTVTASCPPFLRFLWMS